MRLGLWLIAAMLAVGCASAGADAPRRGQLEPSVEASAGAPGATGGSPAIWQVAVTAGTSSAAEGGAAGAAGGSGEAGEAGSSAGAGGEAPGSAGPAAPQPLHVLFLGGQSNVIAQDGVEPAAELADVPLIAHSLGPAGYEYDTGPEPVTLGSVSGFHSIEISAARELRRAGLRVAVAKVARGSSWLGQWRSFSPAHYWDALVDMHDRAQAAWGGDAGGIVWHFVWLQSESDSMQGAYAADYEANLRAFTSEVRAVFGPIEFWQCKLQPSLASVSAGPIVAAAQLKVMGEDPHNHLLDFDDVNGALHYTSTQLDVLGARTAAALVQADQAVLMQRQ